MKISINGISGRSERGTIWKDKIRKFLKKSNIKTVNTLYANDIKKDKCDYLIHILTGHSLGTSVSEAVSDMIKNSNKTVLCIMKQTFSNDQLMSIEKMINLAEKHGYNRTRVYYEIDALIGFIQDQNKALIKESPDINSDFDMDLYFVMDSDNGKKEKEIVNILTSNGVKIDIKNDKEDSDLIVHVLSLKDGQINPKSLNIAFNDAKEYDDVVVCIPDHDKESDAFKKIQKIFDEYKVPVIDDMDFLIEYLELMYLELKDLEGDEEEGNKEEIEEPSLEEEDTEELEESEEETPNTEESEEEDKEEEDEKENEVIEEIKESINLNKYFPVHFNNLYKESPSKDNINKLSDSEIYEHLNKVLRLDNKIKKFLDSANPIKPSNAEFDFLRIRKQGYTFDKNIERYIETDKLVLLYNADSTLSKSLMFMPFFKSSNDFKMYVNITSLAKEKEIVKDGETKLEYRLLHDKMLENILVAAYTIIKAANNPNLLSHNFKIRRAIYELYSEMMLSTFNRLGSVANKTENSNILRYIICKYLHLKMFDLGYNENLENTCRTLTETKNIDKIEVINMKHKTEEFMELEKVFNIIKETFPQLKVDIPSFIKVQTMLYGELSILSIDYIPYLIGMAFSERSDFAIYTSSKAISKNLKLECNRLQTALLTKFKR